MKRQTAEEYASWFKALSDPTRLEILHDLASRRAPTTCGELVESARVAQSTVSAHLKILVETDFVRVHHAGTRSIYQVNPSCLRRLPEAAEVVMALRLDADGTCR